MEANPPRSSPRPRPDSRTVVVGLLLVAGYLATRLPGLATRLPIFLDEAIYMVWGWRLYEGEHVHRSLVSGKLLTVALTGLALRLPADPLWTVRLSSVVAGAVTLAACYGVGLLLDGALAATVAGLLCVVSPLAVLHDRLCLADNWLAAFSALTLLLALRFTRRPSRVLALLTALAMVAAVLAKVTGVVVVATPLLAFLLLPRTPGAGRALLWTYAPACVLLSGPLLIFSPAGEIRLHTAVGGRMNLIENLQHAGAWLLAYWTLPLALALLAALVFALARRPGPGRLLSACALAPVALVVLTSRYWTSRFLLATVVPVALIGGLAAAEVARSRARRLLPLAALLLIGPILFDAQILWQPGRAPLPAYDREQYWEGWTAGHGAREAAAWLAHEAAAAPRPTRVVAHAEPDQMNAPSRALRALLARDEKVAFLERDLGAISGSVDAWRGDKRPDLWLVAAADERAPWFQALAPRLECLARFPPSGLPFVSFYRLRDAETAR